MFEYLLKILSTSGRTASATSPVNAPEPTAKSDCLQTIEIESPTQLPMTNEIAAMNSP